LKSVLHNLLGLSLLVLPLGALSIKHWANVFFALAVFSAAILLLAREPEKKRPINFWLVSLSISFAAFVFSDVLAQLARGEFAASYLDAPFRLLLGIPLVFYFARKGQFREELAFAILCLSFTLTLLLVYFIPGPSLGWGGRWATKPADPNSLGIMTGVFLMVFLFLVAKTSSIPLFTRVLIGMIGLAIAALILTQTQSRGGWIIVPLISPVLLILLGREKRLVGGLLTLGGTALLCAVFIYSDSRATARFLSIQSEFISWFRSPNAADYSVGIRLNMIEASWELFKISPWFGNGDIAKALAAEPALLTGKVHSTTISALAQTPHNEILGRLVRSGLIGGVAAFAVFFVPLALFTKRVLIRSANSKSPLSAEIGLIFVSACIVGSMSAGILGLTYLSALYAGIVLPLCGLTVRELNQIRESNRNA
jgi:O-antigen ligase